MTWVCWLAIIVTHGAALILGANITLRAVGDDLQRELDQAALARERLDESRRRYERAMR